jgi:hypothetical protein
MEDPMRPRLLTAFLTLITFGFGGTLAQQQQSAEPTLERKIASLQYQWQIALVASMMNAREHGQDPTQFGTSVGRWFANRWGPNLTPRVLGEGMEMRFRLVGFETELVDVSDTMAVFYWSGPDPEVFVKRYGSWGASVRDFQAVMTAVVKQIAADGGLVWDQHAEGSRMLVHITKKP